MSIKNWKDAIVMEFPKELPITEKTINETKHNASKFRGSVRVAMGKIWKSLDYEIWRTNILNKKLP